MPPRAPTQPRTLRIVGLPATALVPPRPRRPPTVMASAHPDDLDDDALLALGTVDEPTAPMPAMLGGYLVTRVLASGGMGVVYRGEHPRLGRPVAIKVLHRALERDPHAISRFFAEAVATGRITHPNVVSVFDYGHDRSGAAFLVMELLEGETLAARLAQGGALPVALAVEIARQTSLALAAAHQRGVIHRDLKPDNLFLAHDRARAAMPRVKLLDFGIAKVAGLPPAARPTRAGHLLGTPAYMSPEQSRSSTSSDPRSDLYALGCILYEMVCGEPPFAGGMVDLLLAHQRLAPPAARERAPELPPALDRLIARLLDKAPARRPSSATDLADELTAMQPPADRARLPNPARLRSANAGAGRSAGPSFRRRARLGLDLLLGRR